MRVLILGGTGMLGHKLVERLSGRLEIWTTVRGSAAAWRGYGVFDGAQIIEGVDAASFGSVVRALAVARPQAVVNCIGVVKQLAAAKDPLACISVNALWPHQLAELCRAAAARLIHISTDCVFSGRKGNYTELDPSDAEDLYGRTKYLGEVSGAGAVTLRTSIVGREMGRGSGLFEWFFRQRGGKVQGFRRAIYSGLTTLALAEVIHHLLVSRPSLDGLYHVSAEPVSKFDLLRMLNEAYALGVEIEADDDFVCDRSLDSARFRQAADWQPPSWPEMIAAMRADSTPYDEWRSQ